MMTNKVGAYTRKLSMDKANEELKKKNIIKKSMRRPAVTNFYTPDGKHFAVCLVASLSKKDNRFWFGLKLEDSEILNEKRQDSWLVLGCAESSNTPKRIFLIPWAKIADKICLLSTSKDRDHNVRHYNIGLKQHESEWCIHTISKNDNINVTEYCHLT